MTHESNAGFSALFSIIIVAAAVLLLSRSAAILGLGELDLGYTHQKGQEALAVADGCVEEALRRIRLDANYAGNTELTVTNGTCSIVVVDPEAPSNQRVVTVVGTQGVYNKVVEVVISLSSDPLPVLTVESWAELDS